jgi:hypothetical protein
MMGVVDAWDEALDENTRQIGTNCRGKKGATKVGNDTYRLQIPAPNVWLEEKWKHP